MCRIMESVETVGVIAVSSTDDGGLSLVFDDVKVKSLVTAVKPLAAAVATQIRS